MYTLNIKLKYNCYSFATKCDTIHNLSRNFHAKIAIQLYKIISDIAIKLRYDNNSLCYSQTILESFSSAVDEIA